MNAVERFAKQAKLDYKGALGSNELSLGDTMISFESGQSSPWLRVHYLGHFVGRDKPRHTQRPTVADKCKLALDILEDESRVRIILDEHLRDLNSQHRSILDAAQSVLKKINTLQSHRSLSLRSNGMG